MTKCTVVGLTGFTDPTVTWVQANLPNGQVGWANAIVYGPGCADYLDAGDAVSNSLGQAPRLTF
ncbi:MAG: hypothetical protein R3C44_21270 [Chloroflexota bacterium]